MNQIKHFEQFGTMKNRLISRWPTSVTDEKKTRYIIAVSFIQNPYLCLLRKVSQQYNIDHKSVHKILKLIKFNFYKVKFVQEFNDDDPDCRLEFCDLMMERIDDPNFLFNIVFSDEVIFELNGHVNRLEILK